MPFKLFVPSLLEEHHETFTFQILGVGVLLTAMAVISFADDAKDEAIKKDRKKIEVTWRIVALEINGNKASEEDAKKLTVVNGADGSWSLNSEGNEVSQGTCIASRFLVRPSSARVGHISEGSSEAPVRGWDRRDETRRIRQHPCAQASPGRMDDA